MSRPQNIASKGLASRGIAPNANLLSRTYSGPHADEAVLQYLQTRSDICEGPIEIYIDTTNDNPEVIHHHHPTDIPSSPASSHPRNSSSNNTNNDSSSVPYQVPSPGPILSTASPTVVASSSISLPPSTTINPSFFSSSSSSSSVSSHWKKRWVSVGNGFISIYEYTYGDTPLAKGKLLDKIPFDMVLSLRTMCETINNNNNTSNLHSNEFLLKIQGIVSQQYDDHHHHHHLHHHHHHQPSIVSPPFSTVSTPDTFPNTIIPTTNNDSFFIPLTRTTSSNLSLDKLSVPSVSSFYSTHSNYTIRFRTKTADERRHWVFSLQKVLVMGIMDYCGRKNQQPSYNGTPSITPRNNINNNNNYTNYSNGTNVLSGTTGLFTLPRIESISTMFSNDTMTTNYDPNSGPFGLVSNNGTNHSNSSSFINLNDSVSSTVPFQYSSSVAVNSSNISLLSSSFHPSLLRNQLSFSNNTSTATTPTTMNTQTNYTPTTTEEVRRYHSLPIGKITDNGINYRDINEIVTENTNISIISSKGPSENYPEEEEMMNATTNTTKDKLSVSVSDSDSDSDSDDYPVRNRTTGDEEDEEDIFGNTLSPKKYTQPIGSAIVSSVNTNKPVQISGRLAVWNPITTTTNIIPSVTQQLENQIHHNSGTLIPSSTVSVGVNTSNTLASSLKTSTPVLTNNNVPTQQTESSRIIPTTTSLPTTVAVTTPPIRSGAYIPPHLRRQMSMNTAAITTSSTFSSVEASSPFGTDTAVSVTDSVPSVSVHHNHHGSGNSVHNSHTVPPPPLTRTGTETVPNYSLNLLPRRKVSTTIEGYGEGKHVYGIWSAQGARSRMEDAHIALTDLHAYSTQSSLISKDFSSITEGMGYYAIFDGHSGRYAADYAREHVVQTFVKYLSKHDQSQTTIPPTTVVPSSSSSIIIQEALTQAFLDTDKTLLQYADEYPNKREYRSGTTAIAITIKDNEILVASLGDCRAVLVRPRLLAQERTTACIISSPLTVTTTNTVPSPMINSPSSSVSSPFLTTPPPSKDAHPLYLYDEVSIEHTPQNEILRVEQAGGWVKIEKELSVSKIRHMDRSDPFVARRLDRGQDKLWTIVSRICGELGVSRALGDPDYKGIDRMNQSTNDWAWPLDRPLDQKRFLHDLVLGIPELTRIDIGHEHAVLLRNLSLTTTTTTTTTVATNKEEVTTNEPKLDTSLGFTPSAAVPDSTLVPFLIVACDGLWEVMSSSEAMEIVIDYMRQNHYGTLNSIQKDSLYSNSNSLSSSSSLSMDKHNHHHDEDIPTEHIPTGAARRLVEMALKLGTSDNVTVMIIMLPPKNNLIPADSSSP